MHFCSNVDREPCWFLFNIDFLHHCYENTFNIISIWIGQFHPTWIKRQILLVIQTISCYSTARTSIVSERHGIKGFNGTDSEQSWCSLLNASMGTLANSAIPHLHEKPITSTHHSVYFLSGPVISLYSPGRRNSILTPPKKISTNVFPQLRWSLVLHDKPWIAVDISPAKLLQDLKLKVIVIYFQVDGIALALHVWLELLRCEFDGALMAAYGMAFILCSTKSTVRCGDLL